MKIKEFILRGRHYFRMTNKKSRIQPFFSLLFKPKGKHEQLFILRLNPSSRVSPRSLIYQFFFLVNTRILHLRGR